jgi:hypothetical protein
VRLASLGGGEPLGKVTLNGGGQRVIHRVPCQKR